jgi:hypothetical protein
VIATSCCQIKILLILSAEDLFFATENLMAHFDQRSRSPFYASAMGARGMRAGGGSPSGFSQGRTRWAMALFMTGTGM